MSSQKDKDFNIENGAIPFTARLMAYYRAQECKLTRPLIVDPFAERLAGDMASYVNKHRFVTGLGDYSLVRTYYIENNLLTPWCFTQRKSQIVLLGAGLDTRVYRFKPLQKNTHTIFEIDFAIINNYKEEIMKDEQQLCDLVRLSTDLSSPNWVSRLIKSGFSENIPTFWVLEGLVYYLEQSKVISLLTKAAKISAENSQIFVDICVPALAELDFGPYTRHFQWGLDKITVPLFFSTSGWNVSCSFADDHDQGRDVGQRGLIFVHGTRDITKIDKGFFHTPDSLLQTSFRTEKIKDSELQESTIELTKKVIPEVERIVEIYKNNPKEGLSAYLGFIKRIKPKIDKIVEELDDPIYLGAISPRLLRDPLSVELVGMSSEEKEAHVVGYLTDILQLIYCEAKGLEGWQFSGISLLKESLKIQHISKINILSSLIHVIKREINDV